MKVDILGRHGTDVKQTTEGKTVSTVDEKAAMVGLGRVKLGLSQTTTQEDDKPPKTETVPGFSLGKFEESNAEIGLGVGGCIVVCLQGEVGIQADKVINDVEGAVSNYAGSGIDPNTYGQWGNGDAQH